MHEDRDIPAQPPAEPRLRGARIAFAHDWLVGYRGGEAVLERIIEACTAAGAEPGPVFTMFNDRGTPVAPAVDALDAITPPGGQSRAALRARRWLLPAYPALVTDLQRALARAHRRQPFDAVVSTSSCAIKGLRPPRGVPHICYCHSPARYLWFSRSEYDAGAGGAGGLAQRAGLRVFGPGLRAWDRRTAPNVSRYLAASQHVRVQIRKSWDLDAGVLYPPVRTALFTPDASVPRDDFWLIVAALEPFKRVELACEAARLAGRRLVVAGGGSLLPSLKRRYGGVAEFIGPKPASDLLGLYRRARLLLFPSIDDFGIVPVEAQACGCPVVARAAGGALETVIEGQTGGFATDATPAAFAEAAARVEAMDAGALSAACHANALRFGHDRFDKAVVDEIAAAT